MGHCPLMQVHTGKFSTGSLASIGHVIHIPPKIDASRPRKLMIYLSVFIYVTLTMVLKTDTKLNELTDVTLVWREDLQFKQLLFE